MGAADSLIMSDYRKKFASSCNHTWDQRGLSCLPWENLQPPPELAIVRVYLLGLASRQLSQAPSR